MKRNILTFILFILFTSSSFGASVLPAPVPPSDLPTVEQLIALHKLVAKAEEEAKNKCTTSATFTQKAVTTATNKFYEVRDVLNSKLDIAYQWVTLAGQLSNMTLSTANLLKEYANYTKFFTQAVKHKPQIALQYAECNYVISQKVKLIEKSFATLAASNTNIFKATMKERMEMLWDLSMEIDEIRSTINNSYWWSRCIVIGGFHYDFIWDILNSQVTDAIAKEVINSWNADNGYSSI